MTIAIAADVDVLALHRRLDALADEVEAMKASHEMIARELAAIPALVQKIGDAIGVETRP